MAAKDRVNVLAVDVPKLQTRLRSQKQVIDFVDGQPEQFAHKDDPTLTR